MKLDYNQIYSIAQDYWDKLNLIKEYANGLYDKTKFLPDKDAANDYYKSMCVQLGLNQNNASIDSIEEKYYQYSNYIIAARDLFKGFIETNPDFIAEDQEIINYYSTISYYVEKIQGDNYYKYLQFIISSRDAKNYFTSRSLKVDKDMVELNIILIDNYKKDTLYNETLPFFSEKTCSFDFSTGFYYNNLIENSYYLEKRDSLTNNVIEEEDRKFDIAFGALGNFSYKITNKIRAGIDMGAAISPLDGKMRYLVGAHIMIGRRNQLGLNAGLAIAKLKVLSNSVKTDDTGKYVPAAVTSVPTYEKVRQGFYIGITYNLTSKKK